MVTHHEFPRPTFDFINERSLTQHKWVNAETKQRFSIIRNKNDSFALHELIYLTDLLYLHPNLSIGGLLGKCLCTWGVLPTYPPSTTVAPTTYQTPSTTDHLPKNSPPPTTDLKDHRPPTNGCKNTDHHPWPISYQRPPTTDQITVLKPPAAAWQICFMLCPIFRPLRFYGTECLRMNGAGLDLQSRVNLAIPQKPREVKQATCQSVLNIG